MKASLLEPLPSRLEVGRGTAVFARGRCEAPVPAGALEVSLWPLSAWTPVRRAGEEWWAIVPVEPIAEPGSAELVLRATAAGADPVEAKLATVALEPGIEATDGAEAAPEATGGPGEMGAASEEPAIAICMATHEPPPDLIRRQIDSIREQTRRDWFCVISDDASSPERLAAISDAIEGDDRFRLHPSSTRLGFYANFERALRLAPGSAEYVALADQDDRWHPQKLERLARSLREGDNLAYADMRIISPHGELVSGTYWRRRRNNSSDLESLLIANSVTGAAALFRGSLLDHALPFPPRVGRAYHDHWLALVALATGRLRYLDEPLHDYIQHPGAVIGFASASGSSAPGRGAAVRIPADASRIASRAVRPEAKRRYFDDYCRIALAATVLELRCGSLMSEEKRAAVRSILGADDSIRSTAGLGLRGLRRSRETVGVDRSVLAGLAWSRLRSRRGRAAAPRP